MIKTDRSRIEARQQCRSKRLYGYHWGGKGIAPKSSRYEAAFGIALHEEMSDLLKAHQRLNSRPYLAVSKHLEPALNNLTEGMDGAHRHHAVTEQQALMSGLVNGWRLNRLPHIIHQYEILTDYVEKEYEVEFKPEDYLPGDIAQYYQPVVLMIRLDCLLRDKVTGELVILDFKTASQASEDWSINLDNSLQSNLYIAAVEKITNKPVSGVMYEGLVKGKRELDKAKSSPYNGQIIQYGSFLYGWKDKTGNVHKDYVSGRTREFIPEHHPPGHAVEFFDTLRKMGYKPEAYFPTSVPWRPLDINQIVAQMIVNENDYHQTLDLCNAEEEPIRSIKLDVLFEKSLSMCYKYGSKHPCPFVDICHGKLSEDEIRIQYEERIPHHDES